MLSLHLRRPDTKVTVFDPRPDYETLLRAQLPAFLDSTTSNPEQNPVDALIASSRLTLASSIQDAVQSATIIQEQTPEKLDSKQALWKEVARFADAEAHLWSSSSGIAASKQAAECPDHVKERLVVAHPFNPPHLMPLVEIVPGLRTKAERVEFVKSYFENVPGPSHLPGSRDSSTGPVQHYRPVILHKEVPGFVGNRLAFALLREACYLVGEGVVSAKDLDSIVTASLGPRWAGSGVFESYHAGGGEGGIGGFLEKLAPTMKDVWGQLGQVDILTEGQSDEKEKEKWREVVVRQTEEAYGPSTSEETRARKEIMLKGVIEMQKQCWSTQ
jgi:3-hydroxyacyl-CoA dehydrogenase